MTAKGYTFISEGGTGSSTGKKYTFTSEDNSGKGYQPQDEESLLKSSVRGALQVPQGIAEFTGPGIAVTVWQQLAQGEILDPEEIDQIKAISEREGIPFDEDAYRKAAYQALKTVPTVSNIASGIEETTGLPLEPKTGTQKNIRLASQIGKSLPAGGLLERTVAGAGGVGIKESQMAAGRSEPVADLLAFGAGMPAKEPGYNLAFTKEKPSGMPERRFENVTKPTEVSEKKISQINEKLEKDFRSISEDIIKDSPIGETAKNLSENPLYIRETENLLNEAQQVADTIKTPITSESLQNEMSKLAKKNIEGFALSEYDKNYIKYMTDAATDILVENVTASELVQQYRKNNKALGEYFEPGSSKALNRAKRDALLDTNRSIANVMERSFPESTLSEIFKEGNKRWSQIKDFEFVDDFINEIFKGERINFSKVNDAFRLSGFDRKLNRALGEQGAKDFIQALTDLNSTKKPYSLLKVAKDKGYGGLFSNMVAYMVHPKLGLAKSGIGVARYAYNQLFESMLDKPQIAPRFVKATKDLKKGNYKAAQEEMEIVQEEIQSELKKTDQS